nr:zinc finger, CCHC-type [Tanacetum cinerariifolium]
MYCSMVSAIVFATSFSEYSWSENKLKSCDRNLSRLSVLQCLLDDRNSCSGSSKVYPVGGRFVGPHLISSKIFTYYISNTAYWSSLDMTYRSYFLRGLWEKPEAELKVSCYADASFQTDKDDTKSQTIYVFVLNGGAVDWKSAKQSITAMSST